MRLSLVLPTYNETENLEALFAALTKVLRQHDEVLVVDDDSPDRTWEKAERLRTAFPWLRVVRRVGRRGLSSAVMEGCRAATGDVLAVMDADLQHDPSVLRQLCDAVEGGADIAVASRYRSGGSVGEWAADRKLLSRAGTRAAQMLLPVRTTDPMSGFFAVRASLYRTVMHRMHPRGFKILLELLSVVPSRTVVAEVPLQFHPRLHGKSKMSVRVLAAFGWQLCMLVLRRALRWSFWLLIAVAVLLTLLWAPRVWALRSLWNDDVRTRVHAALASAALREGWLLSDVELLSIEVDGVRVMHRRHGRGRDPSACYHIAFVDAQLIPCAE